MAGLKKIVEQRFKLGVASVSQRQEPDQLLMEFQHVPLPDMLLQQFQHRNPPVLHDAFVG